jgi:hypothetical protein
MTEKSDWIPSMCETRALRPPVKAHNALVAESVRPSGRLELADDVVAVLRPEEVARLRDLRDIDRVRCAVCAGWIEPESDTPASVSVALHGDQVSVEFAHADCAPSRADLAGLVVLAQAEPLGIEYAQALHPEAGAVLLWERKLDLRAPGIDGSGQSLYLDADWWDGFHPALADEPVRLLAGWLLQADGDDLALRRGDVVVERFAGACTRAPAGWRESLEESGFCLLIVGAGIGLERPGAAEIQQAIREQRVLMGLAEFEL